MRLFEEETLRILRALEAKIDITIVGARGSGRSKLLRTIITRADELGLMATTIPHSRTLHDWPFEALQAASITAPAPTVVAYGAALAAELTDSSSRLLVIDDEDHLDPASRAAVDLALARTGVTLVTAVGFTEPTARSTNRLHRRCIRIDMPSLQFDEVGQLMSAILGGTVNPALIARVRSKTAGNIGLVRALTVSARSARSIAQRRGIWEMIGAHLWNAEIHEHVGEMLASYGNDIIRSAHTLALAGVRTIGEARSLIDDGALDRLALNGLTTVIGAPSAEPVIALTPPLITDYLLRRPVDAMSLLVSDEISARTSVPRDVLLRPRGDTPETLDASEVSSSDTIIARYLNGEDVMRSRAQEHLWRESPTVAHALRLLNLAWVTSSLPESRAEIFAVTRHHDPAADASRAFVLHEALWVTYAERDLRGGLRVLDAFTAPEAGDRQWADAIKLLLRGTALGITDDMLSDAARLAAERNAPEPIAQAVCALLHAIAARGADALATLEGVEPGVGLHRVIVRLATGLARLSLGEEERLAHDAATALTRARAQLSKVDIVVESYLLTIASAHLGRVHDVRRALDLTLLFSNLPLALSSLQVAMTRAAGLLALRNGWGVSPEAFGDIADQWADTAWSFPMAQPALSAAIRHQEDGRPDLAATSLIDAATDCIARGWTLAAVTLGLTAVRLAPSPGTADALHRILDEAGIAAHRQFATFVGGVTQDPRAAAELARAYRSDGDIHTALIVLTSLRDASASDHDGLLAIESGITALIDTIGERDTVTSADSPPPARPR